MNRRSLTHWTLVASVTWISLACSAESPRPPVLPAPPATATTPAPIPPETVAVAVGAYTPPDTSTQASETPPDTTQQPPLVPEPPDTLEEPAIRTADGKVSRVRGDLHITLSGGRTAIYKGRGYGDMYHRYEGYLRTMRSHLIHLWGMEGSGVRLIVDDSTGDTTAMLSAPPNFSPDSTRFVVTALTAPEGGGDAGYDAVEIEVWRVVPRKPVREFALEPEGYVPSTAVWRDSVTIDFIKTTFVPPCCDTVVNTRARLRLTGGKWVTTDP